MMKWFVLKILNKFLDGVECSEDEHAKNRRTEFKVLNFNYVDANTPKTPVKTNKPKTEEEEQ